MIRILRTIALGLALTLAATAAVAQDAPAAAERRDMVLIHGLGGSAAVWDDMKPFLEGSFRVHLFELSGHGSTRPEGAVTLDGEVERLDEFLTAENVRYPVLVGHGLGGMIALQYALDHPAEVRRLVMMDSAPVQLATQEEKASVGRQLVENYDAFVAERFMNMTPDREITNDIVDMALRTHQASFTTLLMSSFDFDVTDRLPKLTVPLLVIGSQLMFPSDDSSEHMLHHYGFDKARSLVFKRIEHCGHYMMLEREVYTASVVLAFAGVKDHVFEEMEQGR